LTTLESLLAAAVTPEQRSVAHKRIEYVLDRIAASRGKPRDLRIEQAYYDQLAVQIARRPDPAPGNEQR
jgi:hypothetical protein